jgi:hypothetical protein
VADARNWGAALTTLGFQTRFVLDGQATRSAILTGLQELVSSCKSGDVAVFQFAGHGTSLRDVDNDEEDAKDEALCPVDMQSGGFIIDDDLRRVFDSIPTGVQLTCFIDCCHSGTITRVFAGLSETSANAGPASRPRFIAATPEMQAAHEAFRRTTGMRSAPPLRGPDQMKEVLFSACLPSEVAFETSGNGDFTSRAVPLLSSAAGKVSNAEFQTRITAAFGVPARQHPNLDCAPAMASQLLLQAL